ncbi:hypothetical protein Mterra_03390 [Calidithermus terrae]|uniref:Uncharacterized protein n=1 Tax=Calidithermus terrae TaxID=1408545 RepID=A0A399E8P6_9DEIN|nr:hypothetical protein [Calidithermus terrae]RIH81107.1 hypothetical protein Mterra_03390 [Calidithermus terrae]
MSALGSSWLLGVRGIPGVGDKALKAGADYRLQGEGVYVVSLEARNLYSLEAPVTSAQASYTSSPRTFSGFAYRLLVSFEVGGASAKTLVLCYLAPGPGGAWEGNGLRLRQQSGNRYSQDGSGTCSLRSQ